MGRPGCNQCCGEEGIVDCNIDLDIKYISANNEELFLSKEDFLDIVATTDDEKPEDAPDDYEDRVISSGIVDFIFSNYHVFNYGETLSRVSIELDKEDTYSFSFNVGSSYFYKLVDRMEVKTANREVFCKYSNSLSEIPEPEDRYSSLSLFELEVLEEKYSDFSRERNKEGYSDSLSIDISPDILNVYTSRYFNRRQGSYVSIAVKEEVGEYINEDELSKFSSEVIFDETKFVQEVNQSPYVNSGKILQGFGGSGDEKPEDAPVGEVLTSYFSRIITYDKDLNLVKIFVVIPKNSLVFASASYKDYRALSGVIEVGDFTNDYVDVIATRKKEEIIRNNSYFYINTALNNNLGNRYIYVTDEDEDEDNGIFYLSRLRDEIKESISDSGFLQKNFYTLPYYGSDKTAQFIVITIEEYIEDITTIFLDTDFLRILTDGQIEEDRINALLALVSYKEVLFKYTQGKNSSAEFTVRDGVTEYLYSNSLRKPPYPIITFENGANIDKTKRQNRFTRIGSFIGSRNTPIIKGLLSIAIRYNSISGPFMNGENIYLEIIDSNLGFDNKTALVGKQFFISSSCGSVTLRPWIPYYASSEYSNTEEETYGYKIVHNYFTNDLYYGKPTTYFIDTRNTGCRDSFSNCYCCFEDYPCGYGYNIYENYDIDPLEQTRTLSTSNSFTNPSPYSETMSFDSYIYKYNPYKINTSVVLEDPNDGFLKRGYIYKSKFYESLGEAEEAMLADISKRRRPRVNKPSFPGATGDIDFPSLSGTISTFLYHKFPSELPSIKTHDYVSQWPSVFYHDIIPRLNRSDPNGSYVDSLRYIFSEQNSLLSLVNQSDKLYYAESYIFDKTALLSDDLNICRFNYGVSFYIDEPIISSSRAGIFDTTLNDYDNILVRPSKKEYYTYAYSTDHKLSIRKDESERVGIFDDITDLKKKTLDFNVHSILFSKPSSNAELDSLPASSIEANLSAFWNESFGIVFDSEGYKLRVSTLDLQDAIALYRQFLHNQLTEHPYFDFVSYPRDDCGKVLTYENIIRNNTYFGGFIPVVNNQGGGIDSSTPDYYTYGCIGSTNRYLGSIPEYSISTSFNRLERTDTITNNNTNSIINTYRRGAALFISGGDFSQRVNIEFEAEEPFGENLPLAVPTGSISVNDNNFVVSNKLYNIGQNTTADGLTFYKYLCGFEFDIYRGFTYQIFPKKLPAYIPSCDYCSGTYFPFPPYDTACSNLDYTVSLTTEARCPDGSVEEITDPSCQEVCGSTSSCGIRRTFKSASVSTTANGARRYYHIKTTLDNIQPSTISLKEIGNGIIETISPSSLEWDYKIRMFKW